MKTFVPGAIAAAAEVNANFTELQTLANSKASISTGSISWVSPWNSSNASITVIGKVALIHGKISRGAPFNGTQTNIGIAGLLPSTSYGDFVILPAGRTIVGTSQTYYGDCCLVINSGNGNIHVSVPTNTTDVYISATYLVA